MNSGYQSLYCLISSLRSLNSFCAKSFGKGRCSLICQRTPFTLSLPRISQENNYYLKDVTFSSKISCCSYYSVQFFWHCASASARSCCKFWVSRHRILSMRRAGWPFRWLGSLNKSSRSPCGQGLGQNGFERAFRSIWLIWRASLFIIVTCSFYSI